jgi:hypothetical protein
MWLQNHWEAKVDAIAISCLGKEIRESCIFSFLTSHWIQTGKVQLL